MVDIISKGSI